MQSAGDLRGFFARDDEGRGEEDVIAVDTVDATLRGIGEHVLVERIRQAALDQNVLTYPTQGCVDGINGDHILLAPPFIISREESAQIARALHYALQTFFPT